MGTYVSATRSHIPEDTNRNTHYHENLGIRVCRSSRNFAFYREDQQSEYQLGVRLSFRLLMARITSMLF